MEASKRSKLLEDIAFGLGVLVLVFTAGAEGFLSIRAALDPNITPDFQLPWANVVTGAALVIPKTLGRATAGKIWNKIVPRKE